MENTARYQQPKHEPIAIIGIGCRLPGGVTSPETLWELLINKRDAIIDVPENRWDKRRFSDLDAEKPGKMYVNQGGFLQEDISLFDPLFFGISPREAPNIDPQQRLLLETTYEAIEDAGLQTEALRGKDIGVFIGGFFLDFKLLQLSPYNREVINMHTGTGATMTVLSNRISYTFDFRGPAISMDTACSSSLIAVHYACQSIWNNESSMAIAGGVHVMLRPESFIALSKGGFLSKHGRCKAFDKDAGGYVRGEGAGIVILKPYSKAVEDNDPIYALIKATGANQDGKTSGITVPNPLSQEALIRRVYKHAGIDSNDIHYVEAHGTGTQAGDTAEMRSLNAVLSDGRQNGEKVLVGSIKTNLGHLEAVAGVAGVIKAALCLKHKQVPPNLHFSTPNPKLNYEQLCLRVPTQLEDLPRDRRSYVSVNSFGYGGTNAHAVLQEVPLSEMRYESNRESISVTNTIPGSLFILPITAQSDEALKESAKRHADYIRNEQPELKDLIYTASFRRSHHQSRLSIIAESGEQMAELLESFSEGQLLQGIVTNQANMDTLPKIVFVFTGMGPQWWAMGRELMDTEPIFRQTLEVCDQIFRKHAGWSILEELLKDEDESRMAETQVAQPANFFIQVGLTELWKAYGIEPDAIVGHSVGEVTASYASGGLSLEDAVLVSFHRGRLQQRLAGQGKLLAVGMSEANAVELLKDFKNISIAAINSPNSVTLAGKEEMLQKVANVVKSRGIFNRMLQVEIPYHSCFMDSIEAELLESLDSVKPQCPTLPVYSTVTTKRLQRKDFGVSYWWQNVRQPVRFAKTIETMLNDGYSLFLEVGPHPVLKRSIQECLQAADKDGQMLFSLNRKKSERLTFYETLGTFYTLGYAINWGRFAADGRHIKLPHYPWQKDHYWNESEFSKQDRLGLNNHPFCSTKLPIPSLSYEVELNSLFFPFLYDHRVQKMAVWPGAAYVEAGLALCHQETGEDDIACTIEGLEFRSMLGLGESQVQRLYMELEPQTRKYSIYSSFKEDNADWICHATGRVLAESLTKTEAIISVDELRSCCPESVSIEEFYNELDRAGLTYLPHFRTVREIYRGKDKLIAKIEGHESLPNNAGDYYLHPTILDGAIQTLAAFFDKLVIPVRIERIHYYSSPGKSCWSYLQLKQTTEYSIKGDLCLFDESGKIFAELQDLECQRISKDKQETKQLLSSCFYDIRWQETEIPGTTETQEHWLVFAEQSDRTNQFLSDLTSRNVAWTLLSPGESYRILADNHIQISGDNFTDIHRVIADIGDIPINHIAYLWPQEHVNPKGRVEVLKTVDRCMPVVYLVQALAQVQTKEPIKLSIVTRQAQIITEGDSGFGLASAPLWGLGRLISNEHPNIRCKLIDLDSDSPEREMRVLINELLSDNTDEDVAFRAGRRFIKQLCNSSLAKEVDTKTFKQVSTATTPVELTIGIPEKLENLLYQEVERVEPQAGEIEVQVYAAEVNFRDVLTAMGQIPAKVFEDTCFKFGMECSGIVTRVGEGVTKYKPGDEVVIASKHGTFRSYVTVNTLFVVPKSQGLSFAESTILESYITAIYGLRDTARLQKGEKVLIHNATDGVGLAAIQYAQWKGAEIFATTDTPEKAEYLQSIGVEHVMDSTKLKFTETIREMTNGYGVDVVLSAMSGEVLYQSFSLLAPYGRYIKIGKKDIEEDIGLPMQVLQRNVTVASVDIDRMLAERPMAVLNIVNDVISGLKEGYFSALPTKSFAAAKVVEAFTYCAQNKHIGKVVLNFHNQYVEVPAQETTETIQANATYLITGGTRGFGLEIAKWLSSKKADHLILLSRSGAKTEEAKEAIASMEQQGTKVLAAAVDVSNEQEVAQLLKQITETMPPLRGVFHGAMVLDDGFLVDMERERFRKVMMPKVAGALNLHKYTRDLPLDFFISFSSISSLIGNRGQGNYVAANAFLDAFAHFRRARGLSATTVNLGVLSEVGVASRQADVKSLLEDSGMKGFTTEEALQALDIVLQHTPEQIGLFEVNWNVWAQRNPEAAMSSRFQELIENVEGEAGISDKMRELMEQIGEMLDQEKQEYIEMLLTKELAQILRLPVEKIDHNKLLMDQGVDSLMTTEFRNRLNDVFGINVSETVFFSYPTIKKASAYILEHLIPFEKEELNEHADDGLMAEQTLQDFEKLLKSIDEKEEYESVLTDRLSA